jgi:hypothetical protein
MSDEKSSEEFTVNDRRIDFEDEQAAKNEHVAMDEQSCDCPDGQVPDGQGGCMMPEVTFATFIMSLSSTALMHLGEVPEPESGQTSENLQMAKHIIDTLAMLEAKTKNCLDEEEERLIQGLLYELRMIYVVKNK